MTEDRSGELVSAFESVGIQGEDSAGGGGEWTGGIDELVKTWKRDVAKVKEEAAKEGGEKKKKEAVKASRAGDAPVPPISRKVTPRFRGRRDRPRSKTIAMKRLTRAELRRGALANPPVEGVERPQTRAECRDAPRPCPWVACKHHLYLDINPRTGSIKLNFPDLEPWELEHTCALDVADGGGLTLEEIGLITNLTRERVRQVEVRGLLTLKSRSGVLR
jgi:hypothetical protein